MVGNMAINSNDFRPACIRYLDLSKMLRKRVILLSVMKA